MNKLDEIIAQKNKEVLGLKNMPNHPLFKILKQQHEHQNKFKMALSTPELAIIAEIKRRSPSKGKLADINDPIDLAKRYEQGKASALSILTDEHFFSGHLKDLQTVAQQITLPILRKDFIIDPLQIAEAVYAGANAILLIVAVLGNKTKNLLETAKQLGVEVLVEVHNALELEIALQSDAEIIGINNRDLTTFKINTDTAFNLGEKIPNHIIKIAESGITTPELAKQYHQAGFNGVLIGESLVTAQDPARFIQQCRN